MANYRTHLAVSSSLGLGYGLVGYFGLQMPAPSAVLAGGLCALSGMLPDVDADAGKILRESLAFGAALAAILVADRLRQFEISAEWIVLAAASSYLLVRFVFGEFLRRYTVHRGMFHSVPAAIIFGQIAFLLASGATPAIRVFKAAAVSAGYLSHLVLDEWWSLFIKGGKIQRRRSFGTALKFFGSNTWANLSTYLKLALLTYIVLNEPQWTATWQRHEATVRSWAGQHIMSVLGPLKVEDSVPREGLTPSSKSPEAVGHGEERPVQETARLTPEISLPWQ